MTYNLPANQCSLFAEKGYQVLSEGKMRVAISNLTRETRTIHTGQTVTRFRKETEDNEEVLVVNNLSFEEDTDCPMPYAHPAQDADRGLGTDEDSLGGTAELAETKRSCKPNCAEDACLRDSGLRSKRPSCSHPRKAAGSSERRD